MRRAALLLSVLLLAGCKEDPIPKPPALIKLAYTGSMEPAMHGGQIFSILSTPIDKVKIGDVVIIWHAGKKYWVPHQVIAIRNVGGHIGLVTKGLASPVRDDLIGTEDIYGGVVNIQLQKP